MHCKGISSHTQSARVVAYIKVLTDYARGVPWEHSGNILTDCVCHLKDNAENPSNKTQIYSAGFDCAGHKVTYLRSVLWTE